MVHVMQKRFQGWDALDKAIQIEGWKLIMLLRISPLVPYNVLNVMLGSSGITFKTFAFFSTVGKKPIPSRELTYMGSWRREGCSSGLGEGG
jgi:uncharacterized membrane protein YdjX (TVP38/TMEM64 family)